MKKLIIVLLLLLFPSCVPYKGITVADKKRLKKTTWVTANPRPKVQIWKKPKRRCYD